MCGASVQKSMNYLKIEILEEKIEIFEEKKRRKIEKNENEKN